MRGLCAVIVLSIISGAAPTSAAAAERPNVLFLFADDQRADTIAALGNPVIRTPNLDRLVRNGMAFRNAYCLGANMPAVCTPSRNMLLSGRAYFRWTGPLAPATAPNFPDAMKAAGYETFHHGKRSNTATEIQKRFDTNLYVQDEADRTNGQPARDICDSAIGFLEKRDSGKPFFMYLAFSNPHDPRVAADEYRQLYREADIPLPRNFLPLHPFDNGEMTVRDEQLAPWPRTPAEIRRHLHDYYAVISAMDFHIGRLLRKLDDLGLAKKTLIIYSADHGLAVGSHGLMGKQNLYEHSMKVPLVFTGPGIAAGQSDALVYLFDIFPTVCDFTGGAVPEGLDGKSLAGILRGRAEPPRETLFLAYRDVQRAIRDERWKLIRYPHVNLTQLFDLENDPDELKNLVDDPAQAARVKSLLARMSDWQKSLGDGDPLVVSNPRPREWSPP